MIGNAPGHIFDILKYILTLDKNKWGPYATYLGQVQIKGADGAATEENAALGCCPQENALWSSLTMKEHLEIFAAVKGIRKDDAIVAINR